MRAKRLAIWKAMSATAILAVDLAWLRVVAAGPRSVSVVGFDQALGLANGFLFDFGLLGMFNVLAMGLLGLASPKGDRRDFLIGFEAFGLIAMLAYWACCSQWGAWFLPEPRSRHGWGLLRVGEVTREVLGGLGIAPKSALAGHGFRSFILFAVYATVLTAPQVVVALAGGRLARLTVRGRRNGETASTQGTIPNA
ncbi:MAG: hypothetical protein SFX72_17110 [Isosphaeraceae bacterium]|nr:hypothetical protein [Isosphaeraceae bacterium]